MAENIIYHITVPSGACTFVYCNIAIEGSSNGGPVPWKEHALDVMHSQGQWRQWGVEYQQEVE